VVFTKALTTAAIGLALAATGSSATADLPIDTVSVATLPPADAYRLFLSDMAISHFVDGKLMIIDGKTLKVQGDVALGLAGHATLSPDRTEILVSTAYFTKLNRGERIAELDVYDATTLKLKEEINVPSKHAQSMPYRGAVRSSADGHFVFLQNATPATSVSVVDRKVGKFASEVATPGCWMIYPAQSNANRFATLCGDGTMLTVTLDDEGKAVSKKKSAKFFDPDADALFVSAEQDGDNYTFVSFKGHVQTVNVGGDEAVAEKPWALVDAADVKAGWRPGGFQPITIQRQSNRLYVGVHPNGKEGSHKEPAHEIWAFDLTTKKRIARVPGHHSTVVSVTQGDAPRLYGYSTDMSTLTMFDAGKTLRLLKSEGPFGEFATQLDPQ
jgi:methylamine dehydrogenase heavy chain